MLTRAFLLAGGRGTRLLPYTSVLPKALVPVGDLPVMEILLRQLARDGIREAIVSVGHLAGLIEAYFGNGSRLNLSIRYQREFEPLGTAGPLRFVDDWGESESLLVLNGDLLTDIDFAAFAAGQTASGADIQIGTYVREEKVDLGVIDVDESGRVRGYTEKPVHTYQVSMGIYMISHRVHALLPETGRFDMPQLVVAALAQNVRVAARRHDGLWLDIGRLDDHRRATELMAEQPLRFTRPFRGA